MEVYLCYKCEGEFRETQLLQIQSKKIKGSSVSTCPNCKYNKFKIIKQKLWN